MGGGQQPRKQTIPSACKQGDRPCQASHSTPAVTRASSGSLSWPDPMSYCLSLDGQRNLWQFLKRFCWCHIVYWKSFQPEGCWLICLGSCGGKRKSLKKLRTSKWRVANPTSQVDAFQKPPPWRSPDIALWACRTRSGTTVRYGPDSSCRFTCYNAKHTPETLPSVRKETLHTEMKWTVQLHTAVVRWNKAGW